MPRTEKHNPNWGGKRPNSGRKREYTYKKIRLNGTIERSEPERLLPDHELEVCLAEQEDEGIEYRGILLDDIWYDAKEVMALIRFAEEHKAWLQSK